MLSQGGFILKKRFKMFFQTICLPRPLARVLAISLLIVTAGMVSGLSWAAQQMVVDRRVSMSEAQAMAQAVASSGEIPLTVNGQVLERLNFFVGTPTGRGFVRDALKNYEKYESVVTSATRQYGLPEELMVVAMGESGYRNFNNGLGAGIWSFIRRTARVYGLRVDAQVDERLDVVKETDAAMRLLRDLRQKFGDWRLALRAYNEGEGRVNGLIRRHGTRDPWELERLQPSPKKYLPTMTALLLVRGNLERVRQ
jgi:hypothetical protein